MLQFGCGALSGWVVGLLSDGTPVPMAAVIAAMGVAAIGFNLAPVRRR
jgi:hypothetical protein